MDEKVKSMLYPNSDQVMLPGDVIYSSKGWSTFLVGHVGMVGTDLRIHHSHPLGGFSDSWKGYLSRHKFGGTITVFRPVEGALDAARWAEENVGLINKYFFHPYLDNIASNYCSKFIWQAFWFSSKTDITGRGLTNKSIRWVYPLDIKRTVKLKYLLHISL